MLQTPHKSTPKRKRGDELTLSPIKFSFDLSSAEPVPEDGSNSPRSKVAHRFRGLVLEGGGGASTDDGDIAESLPKRQRSDEMMLDGDGDAAGAIEMGESDGYDAPGESKFVLVGSEPHSQPQPEPQPQSEISVAYGGEDTITAAPRPVAGIFRDFPPTNRLVDSKARVKKRTGSPPLRSKKAPKRRDDEEEEERVIVDPVRAALTWQEDEITIYDPEDKDDDGTGVNGIGFKPTPALAHARAMRRRQQMSEYRKREESEARARRTQRRRGGAEMSVGSGQQSTTRKVRFTDGEAKNVAVTTN